MYEIGALPVFLDLQGNTLDDGSIYFGTVNLNPETSPQTVYWDEAGLQPAAQPLRTVNGYIVRNGTIAKVYAATDYSITIRDKNGRLVYSVASIVNTLAAFAAALAGSGGSALVGFIRPEVDAVLRTLQAKGRELPSIEDWTGVTQGTGTDSTIGIQNAISEYSASGGGDLLVPGLYKISGTITNPGNVNLVGRNEGRVLQPAISPQSGFLWYGGASEMFKLGWQVGTKVGGGFRGLKLDGRALASRCVSLKDIQSSFFERALFTGSLSDAVYFNNTDGYDPTGYFWFNECQIALRGGATNNANGLNIDGVGTGVSGVTLSSFSRMRIEHANGHAVRVGKRGDAMIFDGLQTFRADVETGFGVYVDATAEAIGTWNFKNPVLSAGMYIGVSNQAKGWTVDCFNDIDINAGALAVYGPGATDVTINDSISTRRNGPIKVNGFRNGLVEDPMFFRRWDAANNTLITAHNNYLTGGNYAGSSISDPGNPGGSIQLVTGNVATNVLYFSTVASAAAGFTAGYKPQMCAMWTPLDAAAYVARVGFVADLGDPPVNGIYLEAAPATNAKIRCVCRKAGVETAVPSIFDANLALIQWRIEVDTDFVRFLYRTPGNQLWGLAAVITTNIPTVPMMDIVYDKTTAAANKSLHVYDYRIGFDLEI